MIHLSSANISSICEDAAGVAGPLPTHLPPPVFLSIGVQFRVCLILHLYFLKSSREHITLTGRGNIFAFGLFVSPIPTFRRIIRNRSTEHFSGLPYIYALLNCLICTWYGTPLVSSNNIMVMTVNAMGSVFQLVYIILFITYLGKGKKVRMLGLLVMEILLFAIIVVGSLHIHDNQVRRIVVGVLSSITLISMFGSPLCIINLVVRTQSIEFMPFYLSLSTFLMSTSFLLYGVLNGDIFIFLPNGIGTLLGITQLVLYCYYNNNGTENLREPLIESYS